MEKGKYIDREGLHNICLDILASMIGKKLSTTEQRWIIEHIYETIKASDSFDHFKAGLMQEKLKSSFKKD